MRYWQKISSKQILQHPRLSVYQDKIILPSGKSSDYIHFGGKHDSTVIIAQDADGKILVQKEYSYPPDEWLYQFPGGGLEDGESPEQGAKRELSEESNYSGDLKRIGWYYIENRRSSGKLYVFLATNLKYCEGTADEEEEFENYWFQPKVIDKMIAKNKVYVGTMLAAWAFYKTVQNKLT